MHPLAIAAAVGYVVWANRQKRGLARYEASIRAFEARDRRRPPPRNGTLFVGSSTFTFWRSLESTFADVQAINRGFGGSTIAEVTHYLPRIVTPYRPARVVFYAGSNDIAAGHTAQQVAQNFAEFVAALRAALPLTPVYFISLVPGPRRAALSRVFDEANELVRKSASSHFIEVRPVMRDAAGAVDRSLFRWDRLHMNSRGYERWTAVIRQSLREPHPSMELP